VSAAGARSPPLVAAVARPPEYVAIPTSDTQPNRGGPRRLIDGSFCAKDSDRPDTCTVLDNALADGELYAEEHREQVGAATKAVTRGDLHVLVSDLQTSAGRRLPALDLRPTVPRISGWGLASARRIVGHVYTDVDEKLWDAAEWSVQVQLNHLRSQPSV
jgi:hypothetical protein